MSVWGLTLYSEYQIRRERERRERARSLEEGRERMATEGRRGEKSGFGELFVRRGHLKLADAVDCEWGTESERVCAARGIWGAPVSLSRFSMA